MIARIRAAIARLLGRRQAVPLGKVVYEKGSCQQCGRTNAVRDGLCWFCRTGNEPVDEPMSWSG